MNLTQDMNNAWCTISPSSNLSDTPPARQLSALECQPWPTPTDRVRPTQPRPEEDISWTILFQLKLSVIGSLHLSWEENGIPGDDLTFPSSFSHFFLSEVLCRSQAKEWRGSQIRRIRRKLDIIDKTTDLLFPHHLGRTTEISNVKAQKKKIMRNFIIINKTNFLGNKYAFKNLCFHKYIIYIRV